MKPELLTTSLTCKTDKNCDSHQVLRPLKGSFLSFFFLVRVEPSGGNFNLEALALSWGTFLLQRILSGGLALSGDSFL